MVEVLSPAGNLDMFYSAINAGADAVYMGVNKYNARVMANNFDVETYINCIKYAKLRNVKVYLTMNTLLNDTEVIEAFEIVKKLYENGLDAIILCDMGLFYLIKNNLPDLDIHASTQMTTHSLKQVKYLEKLGFKRVVLARELSIEEIKYIVDNTSLEIEVFVHGALCVSYSGQCLMSEMIGNRSANLGNCSASCRMTYTLKEDNKNIKTGYLISKKDIFGINKVQELMDIGVKSLKIEGRNKSKEYVALVTSKYRKQVDKKESINKNDEKELKQIFIREDKSLGYLEKVNNDINSISMLTPKNSGIYLGTVLEVYNKYIKIKVEEDIDIHDGIEIYSKNKVISTIVTCIKDEKGNIINSKIEKGNIIYIGDINKEVLKNSKVYKTSSNRLNLKYRNLENKKIKRDITINILNNQNINVVIEEKQKIEIKYKPEKAISKSIDEEYIKNSFLNTEVDFNIILNLDNNLFIPKSKLNELRRKVVENILNVDITRKVENKENIKNKKDLKEEINNLDNMIYIYKFNKENINKYLKFDNIFLNIYDIEKDENILNLLIGKNVYISIPNIVNKNLEKYIENNLKRISKNIKGILLGNIGYIDLINEIKNERQNEIEEKKENKKLYVFADYTLNIYNRYNLDIYNFDGIVLFKENKELEKITTVIYLDNYITVMTMRFCPIKAFTTCNNCIKHTYHLIDKMNESYNIIPQKLDCISSIVRRHDLKLVKKNVLKCVIS